MYEIGSIADNGARGCGHLQEGGFYASAQTGPEGELIAWTPLVSSGFQLPANTGGKVLPHNYNLVCPPRGVQLIHLPSSLSFGAAMQDADLAPGEPFPEHLKLLPAVSLLDHVGSDYTAFSFAQECARRGPNRRIPEKVAVQLAKHLSRLHAIPIVFTHGAILRAPRYQAFLNVLHDSALMDSLYVEPLEKSVDESSHLPLFYPSHWRKGFGFTVHDDWMAGNPILPELILHRLIHKWVAESFGSQKRPHEVIPAEFLTDGWGVREAAFGVSWITQAIYVCPKGVKAEERTDLIEAGIVPVYAGEPEGESAGIVEDVLEFPAPDEPVVL